MTWPIEEPDAVLIKTVDVEVLGPSSKRRGH